MRPVLIMVVALSTALRAQDRATADESPSVTILPHSDTTSWWLSGQINLIEQGHGSFTSPYTGPNSFRAEPERALSRVLTLYTGVRLGHGWEGVLDIESAGGRGLSDALGLAGFTNLDVVRNPTLGASPYLARLMVRRVIALSAEHTDGAVSPLSLEARLPARRLEIRAGKLGMADFFDTNSVLSDSHRQFTNWTVDNSGAYDYAADTRGYTFAVLAELDTPRWSLRVAEALMPTVANGITLDTNVRRARGENAELELRLPRASVLRLLAYENHANMGSYSEANAAFLAGRDARPDIEAHRAQGRTKYGFGANFEQSITADVRIGA